MTNALHRSTPLFSTAVTVLVSLAVLAASAPSTAQEGRGSPDASRSTAPSGQVSRTPGEVSNVVDEISQEMYSPFCENKTLSMCPSGGAARVRRYIQRKARDGMAKQEIKERVREKYRDQFLDTYGKDYRWKEPPQKDNYPLLALVVAGLIVCAVSVWLFARSRSGDSDEPTEPTDEDWSDEDEIYLDEIRSQYQD